MLQTPSKTTQTLLSPRIPRDNEHELSLIHIFIRPVR